MILAVLARIGQVIRWFFSLPLNESQELSYLKMLLEEERTARKAREELIFSYFGMYRGLQPAVAPQAVGPTVRPEQQLMRKKAVEAEMESKRRYWAERQAKVDAEIANARRKESTEGGDKDGRKIQQPEEVIQGH